MHNEQVSIGTDLNIHVASAAILNAEHRVAVHLGHGVVGKSERKAFLLRLDPKVHRALKRWSDDELRSLNAHIEYLLRDALARAGRLKESGGGGDSRRR